MALPIKVEDILNSITVESERIELKKGWNAKKVMHSICAFANDIDEIGGGYIFVGVEEENGSAKLPPVGIPKKDVDDILKDLLNLSHKIRPNYRVYSQVEHFQGQHIIVIRVTPGDDRPYTAPESLAKGAPHKMYVRQQTSTVVASQQLEKQVREQSARKRFDERINTHATLDDIDLGLLHAHLSETNPENLESYMELSKEDLCIAMDIASGPKEDVKPLNVGLLMFCKAPEKFFPGCQTNLVLFSDKEESTFNEKRFVGPIGHQIRSILEYFETNILGKQVQKDPLTGATERIFNYPQKAVKELVVNSLYHRSFEEDTPNEIRIYTNGTSPRIEIISYPSALPPIDQASIMQGEVVNRSYRHIVLGDWLKGLKLAEKYATGIPAVRRAMKQNGSYEPQFDIDDKNRSSFKVKLDQHPDWGISSTTSQQTQAGNPQLSDEQQEILELCVDSPKEFKTIFAKVDGRLTKVELGSILESLVEQKLINETEVRVFYGLFSGGTVYATSKSGEAALSQSF